MKFWQHLHKKLADHQKVYVLTVIENFGSSPGRKGFKMLVSRCGFIYGSVGGGVMETALVQEAQALLLLEEPPTMIKKQIHRGNIENGSGMICSGEQTVAFHCLKKEHITEVDVLLNCLNNGKNGTLKLDQVNFGFSKETQVEQFRTSIRTSEDWEFKEHIGHRETIYIIGGGHVGVAVSEVFSRLGFTVHVFDNRTGLNTLKTNEFAHHKQVVDYNEIETYLPEEDNSYIAIMTNKYTDDKLVLNRIIRRKYTFVGVLGSKAKLKTMWKDLIKEGFSREELDSIHAPIGLSIKSETPEEIAVSIAAQVIQLKNEQRKKLD